MRAAQVMTLSILCCLVGTAALAQSGAIVSAQMTANTDAATDRREDRGPSVAADSIGRLCVVWTGFDSSRNRDEVYLSRSSDGGVTWTPPGLFQPDSLTDSSAVIRYAAGRGIVVWLSTARMGTDSDLFFARSEDGCLTWSAPAPLNTNAGSDTANENGASLATNGQGTWLANWFVYGATGADADLLFTRSIDNGLTWSPPQPLNTNGAADSGDDFTAGLTPDGAGGWIASWTSRTTDNDPVIARSTNDGATWSAPSFLFPDGAVDGRNDTGGSLATDGDGNWIAVVDCTVGCPAGGTLMTRSADNGATWTPAEVFPTRVDDSSYADTSQTIRRDAVGNWVVTWGHYGFGTPASTYGDDYDIFFRRSTDGGITWTPPQPLNSQAATDSRGDRGAGATDDGAGNWIAVWSNANDTVSDDSEIWFARWTFCGERAETGAYGTRLFRERCSAASAPPSPAVYDRVTIPFRRRAGDRVFLSSGPQGFEDLVVDDEIRLDGVDCGLGPYSPRPGTPPLRVGVPIVHDWVPVPALDITSRIPMGGGELSFELRDTDGLIHGNTPVYLVVDCGLAVSGTSPTTLRFVSHDDSAAGSPSSFEVVTGLLSTLRTTRSFAAAACLGTFSGAGADAQANPASGDGRYYLARGRSSCVASGYGDSSLAPDPWDALDARLPCP